MEQPLIWNNKVYCLLLILVHSISGVPSKTPIVQDVTYDELKDLRATCEPSDSCKFDREMDMFSSYTCDCDWTCAVFDTCCVDSVFRKSKQPYGRQRNIKCVEVYGDRDRRVYMVDRCKRDWPKDQVADLCRGDGESTNDPMLLIPVTSELTGITYKNYFCSICNNDTDAPTLWNLEVSSRTSELVNSTSAPSLKYSNSRKTWEVASPSRNKNSVPVSLAVVTPQHIYTMVKSCHLNLVSKCSKEWTDVDVQQKCAAYMARVFIWRNMDSIPYRNPHCAICNFESVDNMQCFEGGAHSRYDDVLFVSMFVLEDKTKKCDKGEVYDSLGKRCRVRKCPPNHWVKNEKCVTKM